MYELKNYEDNMRILQTGKMMKGEGTLLGVPIDTHISCQWNVNEPSKCVNLVIATNNDCVIRGVIVFAEQLFDGESRFVHPRGRESSIRIPVCSPKDVATDLFLKVCVGCGGGLFS